LITWGNLARILLGNSGLLSIAEDKHLPNESEARHNSKASGSLIRGGDKSNAQRVHDGSNVVADPFAVSISR
jgi:hypothetical protein